jgi:hypothetical protein
MQRLMCLVAILGAIGCGDGTVEVQSLEPNGARSVQTMPEGNALDLRRQQLWTGVAYIMGCGTQRYPTFGGEAVIFENTGYNGYCLATAPYSTVLGASLDMIQYDPSGAPGYTADNNVGSVKFLAPNGKWMRFAFHPNREAGGGLLEYWAAPYALQEISTVTMTDASSIVINTDPIPHP